MASPSPAAPEGRPVLRLTTRSDLIAAIPTLVGFVPTDSAVIVAFRRDRITAVVRHDLAQVSELVGHLRIQRFLDPADTVEIVIVADPEQANQPGPGAPLGPSDNVRGASVVEHQGQIDSRLPFASHAALLAAVLDATGYRVTHAAWLPAVRAGQAWRCYHAARCGGVLPDPRSTPLAAAAAVAGQVTYPSRQALVETLQPDPPDVLERRATLIANHADAVRLRDRAAGIRLAQAAIAAAHAGRLPTTDSEVAELAVALADRIVRHNALRHSLGATARAAQQLWTCLVRATPPPHRAEPAVLLAVTAYLACDGPLASIAAHAALTAKPGHTLAELVLLALRTGLAPEEMRAAVQELFAGR